MELDNILQSALDVLNGLKEKNKIAVAQEHELSRREKALAEKEKDLVTRLANVVQYENIRDAWDNVKKAQDAVHTAQLTVDNAKAQFENETRGIREQIAQQKTALADLEQRADQVRLDKIALEQEKATYKEKIKKELADKLSE